jgi:hypothetical protein
VKVDLNKTRDGPGGPDPGTNMVLRECATSSANSEGHYSGPLKFTNRIRSSGFAPGYDNNWRPGGQLRTQIIWLESSLAS